MRFACSEYLYSCVLLVTGLSMLPALRGADATTGIVEQVLAPHTRAPGKTLFALVPPEESGLRPENRFAHPKMRGHLYQEFETSSIGPGVAIADYDGAGK